MLFTRFFPSLLPALNVIVASVLITVPLNAQSEPTYEEEVISSLEQINSANIDHSIKSISDLISKYPNSKLGHLMLADLFASRAGARNLINRFSDNPKQLNGLRDELRQRWGYDKTPPPVKAGLLPSPLIQSSQGQDHVLVVDASRARLYIYRNDKNGGHQYVDSYYMTIGKAGTDKYREGDLKTPLGVYFVTSYLPGESLPPRYGPGAFPINYPNELDRVAKKTGYGIWIHGTEPENYNRIPLASDGCVSLSNDEFLDIKQYVKVDGSTPVIIADEFNWVSQEEIDNTKSELLSAIDQWRSDWESKNSDAYLSHYSKQKFNTGKHDYNSWANHKTRVNRSKKYIRLGISDLSIFEYPSKQGTVSVTFNQDYQSDTYSSNSKKRQYWSKDEKGQWKIIYEG